MAAKSELTELGRITLDTIAESDGLTADQLVDMLFEGLGPRHECSEIRDAIDSLARLDLITDDDGNPLRYRANPGTPAIKEFEKWAEFEGYPIDLDEGGYYTNQPYPRYAEGATEKAFKAWMASRKNDRSRQC